MKILSPRGAIAFAVLFLGSLTANGQTTSTWNGSTGNWTDTVRWDTAFFPNNGNGGLNYNAIINAGTVTLNQDITLNGLTMSGGSIFSPGVGGPFQLTVNNNLNWTGGTFATGQTLRSNGTATIGFPTLGGTMINAGTTTVNAITGTAGAIVNNLVGASWTQTGSLVGTGTFNNAGTYSVNSGSHQIRWAFNNQAGGIVNINNATLQVIGPGTHDGAFNLSSTAALQFEAGATGTIFSATSSITGVGNFFNFGANLTFNGTYAPTLQTWVTNGATNNFNSAFASTGQLRIDTGGVINLNLPTTLANLWLNGGTLGGAGAITLNGTSANMTYEGGTFGGSSATPIQNLGSINVISANPKTFAHDFNNASGGAIGWTNGPMRFTTGTTLTNASGGAFDATGNFDVSGATVPSDGVFDNFGTVTRSTATGTVNIYSTFHNRPSGVVNVQTGTLNLANPGTLAGTFNISSSATLAFSGTQTLPGAATYAGTGTVAIAGGTTTLTGTLTYPNVSLMGGTLIGTGSIAANSLSLGGVTLGRDLVVNGATSNQFVGGTLTVNSGFSLTIPSGVNLQALAGTITGPGTLVNQASLTKVGTGTLEIRSGLDNSSGLIQVQGGTVQLSSPSTLTGNVNVTATGTLALGANQSVGSTAQISGAGPVNITGSGVTIAGSGLNNYTGLTTVTATGNALVTGTGSAFGTNNVTIASGGMLRLNAAGNLAAGTTATVAAGGTLGLESAFDPASIIHASSAGALAVNVPGFAIALNQATLGNGLMFLGSTGTGSYAAATLTPGSGNTYRLGGGGGTLTLNGTNLLTGMASTLIGATGVTGTVVLADANNYSGNTTVTGATLAVGNNAALGTGTLVLNSGGIRAQGSAVSLANAVTVAGNFSLAGSDNLTLSGNVTLTGNRTITVPGPSLPTISGNIAGDVLGRSLTKDGPGTLTLSGTNTYSGGTTINAGTLKTTGFNQALGLGNVIVNNGGVLRQGAFSNLGGGANVRVNSGGILGLDGNFAPSINTVSSGIVAVNLPTFSVPLNQATMGNGQMFIGSQGTGQYNAATLTASADSTYRLGAAGGSLTIPNANVLTGFNSLLVGSTQPNGTGTLVLGATQNFQGNTTVNAGSTLVLQAALSGPGTVFVLPGATISGSGSIGGFVNVGGGIGPGGSPGVLTFTNGLGFASSSKYIWELSDHTTSGSGTVWDRIDITGGNLSISSAATLDMRFIDAATAPNAGNPFWQTTKTWSNIISVSGTATISGPLAFQIDNSAWASFGSFATMAATVGSGVQLTWTPTPVPEPAHVLLIALGASAAWRCRTKRRLAKSDAK